MQSKKAKAKAAIYEATGNLSHPILKLWQQKSTDLSLFLHMVENCSSKFGCCQSQFAKG